MTRNAFLQTLFGCGAIPGLASPSSAAPDAPEKLRRGVHDLGALDDDFDDFDHEPADLLDEWHRRPLLPVVDSDDPWLDRLSRAVRSEERIAFSYHGGRDPGERRVVTPLLLFVRPRAADVEEWLRHEYEYRAFEGAPAYVDRFTIPVAPLGPADFEALAAWLTRRHPPYLQAWCHAREAKRCFRADRMGEIEFGVDFDR